MTAPRMLVPAGVFAFFALLAAGANGDWPMAGVCLFLGGAFALFAFAEP